MNFLNMSEFNKESTLHAQLKRLYAGPSGKEEVSIGSYVCDGQTAFGEIIEIQTGGFGPLKNKLKMIAQDYTVRIVHPIIRNKYIETYSTENKLIRKRLSPKRGSLWDVFKALLYAPRLVLESDISVELVALDITEKRIADGNGSWRRKGISIFDKELITIHDRLCLRYPEDYSTFIPFLMEETFTILDFFHRNHEESAEYSGKGDSRFVEPCKEKLSYPLAQKAVYVLYQIGLIERTGKRGNFYLYRRRI